jgi:hypothetical protein
MYSRLIEIFEDELLKEKIRRKLPYLFSIAELESSRAGKVGMEVGLLRERILIALLIYKFGQENVETQIPIAEPEIDVMLFGKPISIKTITTGPTARISGIKVIWTVDAQKAWEFFENYVPGCEILFTQIKWDMVNIDEKALPGEKTHPGGLFLIPVEVQRRVLHEIGRERYLSLPRIGTNPRGVEISREALLNLLQDENTKRIEVVWRHVRIDYDPYRRWIDYWKEE